MFIWVAKVLANQGHDVTVLTYKKNNVAELPGNIKWIQKDINSKALLKKIREVKRIVNDTRVDVCVSFLLDANIINTLACVNTRTKSIICERNDPFKPHYYKLKLIKSIFKLSDGGVFQLPKVADYYSMIKGPTAVIPNPVIQPKLSSPMKRFEKRDNIVVSLGRLDVFQKRQDVLIKSFAKFSKDHPDYLLKLFGGGPDENQLKKLAKEEGVSEKVIFAGVTHNSITELCNSKFFVLSSDFEGIPNALIEAMSVGLPCISTKCSPGGAELLIEDGVNGLLVDTGDVNGIYNAMKKLTDSNYSDYLGDNARKICSNFSESKITALWCDYISQFQTN